MGSFQLLPVTSAPPANPLPSRASGTELIVVGALQKGNTTSNYKPLSGSGWIREGGSPSMKTKNIRVSSALICENIHLM